MDAGAAPPEADQWDDGNGQRHKVGRSLVAVLLEARARKALQYASSRMAVPSPAFLSCIYGFGVVSWVTETDSLRRVCTQ